MASPIEMLKTSSCSSHPHQVVRMPGDGSCLFHSLSHSVYGNITFSLKVRLSIVNYIVGNWERLGVYTCNESGVPYSDRQCYAFFMEKETTYGSAAELMAAAEMFPFTFEVYQGGDLKARFSGSDGGPVRRLRFTGSDLTGHYDVFFPVESAASEHVSLRKNPEGEIGEQTSISEGHVNKFQRGRPKKKKMGRPKTCNSSC